MNRRMLTAPLLGPLRDARVWHDYRRLNALDHAPGGNVHPATLYGGASLDATNGLVLDGLTGSAVVPYTAALNAPDFSVCFWVNGAEQHGKHLVSRWMNNAGNQRCWHILTSLSAGVCRPRVLLSANGTSVLRDSTAAVDIVDGTWHHVVVTYDGTTLAGYRDGVAFAFPAGTAGEVFATSISPLYVGSVEGASYFGGSFLGVMLFPRVIAAGEAVALAAGGF